MVGKTVCTWQDGVPAGKALILEAKDMPDNRVSFRVEQDGSEFWTPALRVPYGSRP